MTNTRVEQVIVAILTLLLSSCRSVSANGLSSSHLNLGAGPRPFGHKDDPIDTPVESSPGREVNEQKMVLFSLRIGFDEDATIDREPTQEEVEELICVTNEFLQDRLEAYATEQGETEPMQLSAVNIDWSYDASLGVHPGDGKSYPVEVSFLVDAFYPGATVESQSIVHKDTVFNAIDMTEEEIVSYIMDCVWKTDSNSVFYNTVRVHYNVMQAQYARGRTVRLPEATCPETPALSPAPQDPSRGSRLNVDVDVEEMVYFQLEVEWEDTETYEEPTLEEIQALMCAVNDFVQEKVAESTQDASIVSASTNINWISSGSAERAGITLYFTSDTSSQEGGDPVELETVIEALTDQDEELLEFLFSEGATSFLSDGDINPLLQLPSSVTLEALPLGTPVRAGTLEVAECAKPGDSLPPPDASRVSGFGLLGGNKPVEVPVPQPQLPPVQEVGSSGTADRDESANGNEEPSRVADFSLGSLAIDVTEGTTDSGIDSSPEIPSNTITTVTVHVAFLVSNLEGIVEPFAIKDLGLDASWPGFTEALADTLKPQPQLVRGRALVEATPQVDYKPSSAFISSVQKVDCGNHTLADLTCHHVEAGFKVWVPTATSPSDTAAAKDDVEIKRFYQVATLEAILDGTYNNALQEDVPDTPLFIGSIPDNGYAKISNDNHLEFLVVLAIFLVLLLCCCFVLLGMCLWYQKDSKQKEDIKGEEHVIYSHTHRWEPSSDDTENPGLPSVDENEVSSWKDEDFGYPKRLDDECHSYATASVQAQQTHEEDFLSREAVAA